MTTYAVTTSQNVTALTAKAGNDTYNISAGAVLTIDSDSRYGPNTSATTGVLGAIAIAATGGTISIDGTKVRLIPFSGGSGTVPAAGSTITQGGVTSELLGVWSAINTTPTAAAAAMPASGFIKVRNVAGGTYAAGALTGITATSRGADIVGWIEVVGVAAKTFTVTSLGTFSAQGAWLSPFDSTGAEVKTSGSAGQTIQLPASVTNTYYAGVFVETSAGSGVYARWPNAADMVNAATPTSDERGRMCWISASGALVFGSDGTNTVGMVPAANCRIRVPNVLLGNTNATVGFAANAVPTAVTTTRYLNDATATVGAFAADCVSCAWAIVLTAWYSFSMTNSLMLVPFVVSNPQQSVTFSNNITSQINSAAGDAYLGVSITSYNGAQVDDNTIFMQTGLTSSQYSASFTGYGFNFNRNRFHCGTVPVSTVSFGGLATSIIGGVADSNEFIWHSMGSMSLTSFKLTNTKFCGWATGTAGTFPTASITITFTGADCLVDGFSWLLTTPNTCHTKGTTNASGFIVQAGAQNLRFRNFGTAASPLSLGTVNTATVPFFNPQFQVLQRSVKYQKCFFSNGGASAQISGYRGNQETDIENCIVPGATLNFQSGAPSLYRGIRVATAPAPTSAGTCGIHWSDYFTSDTVGAVAIFMCQPNTASAAQCVSTGGAPKFTGTPGLNLPVVGDQMTWYGQYFIQGHTALSSVTMSGGTAANYLLEFQVDTGSGMSAWQTASTTNLAAVSISPTTGFKINFRCTCSTANALTITKIVVNTTSTLVAQQAIAYPLDPVSITVSGLATGSRVKIVRTDTSVVLTNTSESSGVVSISGDYTGVPISVEARCATSPGPYYQPWTAVGTVTSAGLTLTALQVRDDQ